MPVTLEKDGPKKFIDYACTEAFVNAAEYYKPIFNRDLHAHKILSFQDFIWCISKYTHHWKNSVCLDAEVVYDVLNNRHRVVVRGIRDPLLRDHKNPRYLPGHQEGIWDCILEEVLQSGMDPEEIAVFRHALNLLPEYKFSDTGFFQRREDWAI